MSKKDNQHFNKEEADNGQEPITRRADVSSDEEDEEEEDDLNLEEEDDHNLEEEEDPDLEEEDDLSSSDEEEDGEEIGESSRGTKRSAPEEDQDDIEQRIDVPKAIEFKSQITDISCHPKRNIIASGTIDGSVYLHTYATGEKANKEVLCYEHHKKNCRVVKFSDSGEHLFTGASDKKICVVDLETNSVFREFAREEGSPLYSILPIDNYVLASGEEDGQIVLWDFRMQSPIQCFEDCEDYISSLVINAEKKILLATSGDGLLSAYNVRARKLMMQSEEFECDLLCAGIFKKGTKVAVGAGDGSINIFNWGEFGNISDRFPGHPEGVDSMAVFNDDTVCTGCEDGKIRAVQLFPTRFLGVLGSHHGFSVEKLSISHDSSLLASCSHDQKINFWDLSGIEDLRNEDVRETKKKHGQINKQVDDFFEDL